MEQNPATPTPIYTSTLQLLLALLLPLFILGGFFSFKFEQHPPQTAPLLGASEIPLANRASLVPSTPEEQQYVEQVRSTVGVYIETLALIGPLYEEAQEDSSKLSDAAWQAESRALFYELGRISEEVRQYTPPGRYWGFHDKFTKVAQRYMLAGQLYQEGLTTLDEETLLLADEAYSRANAALAELVNNDLPLMRP